MILESKTVTLRKLTADDGMVITDKETQTMRAKELYIAKGERKDNFIEIEDESPSDEEVQYD